MPPPQHPFARYPYVPPRPPPGYVGPTWAAPGPYRTLPARGPSGCVVTLIILAVLGVLGVAGIVVVGVGVVLLSGKARPPVTRGDDDNPAPMDKGPVDARGVPTRRAVDPAELDRSAEQTWAMNNCIDAPMRARDPELRARYQVGYMNRGSAKRLRGRVAVVHLLLASGSLRWTMGATRDVHRSALLTGKFFQQEARRRGITDLAYTPIAWTLPTTFEVPELVVDGKLRITPASSRELVRSALVASEGSLGLPMRGVVEDLAKEGFTEVAFLLHVPRTVNARDFAYPAWRADDVDTAVVFQTSGDRLGYVTAHETMHLFGADDLYPLSHFDDGDRTDLMRSSCRGFGGISIQDMSAYAIGWRTTPPKRAYGTESF